MAWSICHGMPQLTINSSRDPPRFLSGVGGQAESGWLVLRSRAPRGMGIFEPSIDVRTLMVVSSGRGISAASPRDPGTTIGESEPTEAARSAVATAEFRPPCGVLETLVRRLITGSRRYPEAEPEVGRQNIAKVDD